MKIAPLYFTLLLSLVVSSQVSAESTSPLRLHCMNEKTEAQTLMVSGESGLLTIVNQWPTLTQKFGGNIWSCWKKVKSSKALDVLLMSGEKGELGALRSYRINLDSNDCFKSSHGAKRIEFKGKTILVAPAFCIQSKDNKIYVGYMDDDGGVYPHYGAYYNIDAYN